MNLQVTNGEYDDFEPAKMSIVDKIKEYNKKTRNEE